MQENQSTATEKNTNKKPNKKVMIAVIALLIVAAAAAVFVIRGRDRGKLGKDTAVARAEDAEDPNVHYLDDEAIALAGEAEVTALLNEAYSTLGLVNQQRAAAGLPGLVWRDDLAMAALVRANEASILFSHTRPNGTDWWTVNSLIMYGENLAQGYGSAPAVVNAWMNSPAHRANVLGGFTTMGVAIFQAPNGQWFWAQEFGY